MMGFGGISVSVSEGEGVDLVSGVIVTGNYFQLLGVKPPRGRLLQPSDDVTPGAHPVAVISASLWRTRFGERDNGRRRPGVPAAGATRDARRPGEGAQGGVVSGGVAPSARPCGTRWGVLHSGARCTRTGVGARRVSGQDRARSRSRHRCAATYIASRYLLRRCA